MSKKIARTARLVRDVALVLLPVLRVVDLVISIVNKAANYDRELHSQVHFAR
ncbi:MAG: hypothetical protein KF889_19535 [Alphaproteobacteria bacterium]|nr:hypothetical protein [Alphaproteobacteria bacterium]MCW5744031.1 hypothetical protein [Alphaproteobacteria bacterium]